MAVFAARRELPVVVSPALYGSVNRAEGPLWVVAADRAGQSVNRVLRCEEWGMFRLPGDAEYLRFKPAKKGKPMSTNQTDVQARNAQAAAGGVHLPGAIQHVIDSLEAHLNAVIAAARGGSPALAADAKDFADAVLDKLDDWGVSVRGDLENFRKRVDAMTNTDLKADGSPRDRSRTQADPQTGTLGNTGVPRYPRETNTVGQGAPLDTPNIAAQPGAASGQPNAGATSNFQSGQR